MNTPKDMSHYVARLSLDGTKGLGVVTRNHILTCAHFFGGAAVDRFQLLALEAEIQGEKDSSEYFVQTLDCLLDFMVLGYQPIGHEIDIGPQFYLEEIEPPLKPSRLVFPDALYGSHKLPVYYFAPDGRTPVSATAFVYPDSPIIHLSSQIQNGCSGGPVFSADHHLIGIVNGQIDSGGHLTHDGHAVRIDLAATGWLVEELGGLDLLDLENCATYQPNPSPKKPAE